ncbi:MAG: TIGR04083 family peptide-modifying radical SAM enzyme [Armatimonadetes bacterium]|nr:TIGR04083 family peptide-modifying radical SAM enzyme [Armatimonadota bacterium]
MTVDAGRRGHHDEVRRCPHFVVVPSLACPASCSYCFGPRRGPVMSGDRLVSTLDYLADTARTVPEGAVQVTFHGGEPLVAGHDFWTAALEGLRARFGGRCRIAVQSNLWLLDDEFCRLFAEHRVQIGTSLDGPEAVTDAQRGHGHFARTLAAVRRARAVGLDVACIATFTTASLPRWREVFDFFLAERLDFSPHAAVAALGRHDPHHVVSPEQYARTLLEMLSHYVDHRRELAIASLDQMCQGVAAGEGRTCTFRDCLGEFLVIDPRGDIFACQRFAGRPEYRLGQVAARPQLADLLAGPAARQLARRQAHVDRACSGCTHHGYCRGGCPHNAWAVGGHEALRDPQCGAYQMVFDEIRHRLVTEMAAAGNLAAVAAQPYAGRGHQLLRQGPLTDLAHPDHHPRETARSARRVVAAVELARARDADAAAARLVALGICRTPASASASLAWMVERLHPGGRRLGNLYLHVTLNCQLACRHCYAEAGAARGTEGEMPVETVVRLLQQAGRAGFRKFIVTGGEPLLHARRETLLARLADERPRQQDLRLVLRTNLALSMTDEELRQVCAAFDQVVVSVDGDEAAHDGRRGTGSHAAVVRNLDRYQSVAAGVPRVAQLSLTAALPDDEARAEARAAVVALAAGLGLPPPKFRAVLPLGRAAAWPDSPRPDAAAWDDPRDTALLGFRPTATCGLGQHLSVEPNGDAFPCHACRAPGLRLGNVCQRGLADVLSSATFAALSSHTVDANRRCRDCEWRWLCGGVCRAWTGVTSLDDLDAAPRDCSALRARAAAVLRAAEEYLASPATGSG